MGFNQKKEFPFIATATMFAMLSGFLLVFLLPYDQLLAWSLFLGIEAVLFVVIVRRLLDARRKIAIARLERSGSSS